MANTCNTPLQILRLKQVLDRTGKSRSSLYGDMAAGLFPKNITIGARSVGWISSEIDDFLQTKITESRPLMNGEI